MRHRKLIAAVITAAALLGAGAATAGSASAAPQVPQVYYHA